MWHRRLAVTVLTSAAVGFVGAGCGGSPDGSRPITLGGEVGLRDKFSKKAKYDDAAIRQLLQDEGASLDEAREIVDVLGTRLSPDEMHIWLSHPQKSHGIPDPEASKEFEDEGLVPVELNWTAVNAIAQDKTHLVIAEAKRYAKG